MKLSLSTEWLFFHLWKKNPDTNSSCPGVFLADTIIYRWAQPYFWYFTTKEGQILRKTKERIFVNHIEEVFMRGLSSSGVIAIYMQNQEKKSQKKNIYIFKEQHQQEKIEFEYFQDENFKNFLQQREKSLNALLQKFIEPKNSHNSMIKVSWSPQFCLLSRKTNINDMKNTKIMLEERLMTFEGPEYFSESDSISSHILSSDIEQICLNIVKHIQDVSGGNIQISRMILYFKIDEKNRLWLLFSSGIKVRQKFINEELIVEEEKKRNKFFKPERVMSPILVLAQRQTTVIQNNFQNRIKYTQGFVSTKLIDQEGVCVNCAKSNEQHLYKISIGQMIGSYESDILDDESIKIRAKLDTTINKKSIKRQSRDDQSKQQHEYSNYLEENEDDYYIEESRNIPGILLKIWGKMDLSKYQLLKRNPSWLKIQMNICMECFLKFTQTHIESTTERETLKLQEIYKSKKKEQFQLPITSKLESKLMKSLTPSLHKGLMSRKDSLMMIKSQRLDTSQDSIRIKKPSKFKPQSLEMQLPNGSQTVRVIGTSVSDKVNVTPHEEVSLPIPTKEHKDVFASVQALKVYRNKQGLKQLPTSLNHHQQMNSTSSTTMTHDTVIQSIQSLRSMYKKDLEDLQI